MQNIVLNYIKYAKQYVIKLKTFLHTYLPCNGGQLIRGNTAASLFLNSTNSEKIRKM